MSTIENGFSLRQPDVLNGLIEYSKEAKELDKTAIYLLLLGLDSSSLQILKAVGETSGIGSRLLEDKVKLSRAPILVRTKNLDKQKLLSRTVLPGTENHSKPTFIHSLAPGVTLTAINCAIAKLSLEEYLSLKESGSSKPLDQASTSDLSTPFQTLAVMQEMLEVAFRKIAELEGRLSNLEEALQHPGTFDREKLLNIIKPPRD